MTGRAALAALLDAADSAAATVAAAHPDPDLYARPAHDPERQRVTLARLELDELADVLDDIRREVTATLHTEENPMTARKSTTTKTPPPAPAPLPIADRPLASTAPIDPADIAAANAAGVCPRCGQDVAPWGCREHRGSWWCQADGLIGMGVIFRDPTADWTPAQRETYEAYEPVLEEAGARVDEAMEAYATAQAAHHAALLAGQKLGVRETEGGVIILPNGGGPIQGERPRSDPASVAARQEAREVAEDTQANLTEAEHHLSRARSAYYALAARRDADVARAVMTGQAGKPRSATSALLHRIRDRVMG